jgi:enoyl-CoA hydratase/carnithine racemase
VNRKLTFVPNGLILSSVITDAAEAYRIGLVDELVSDAHVIERAEAVLKKIIANARVKYALEAVNKGLETSVARRPAPESELMQWSKSR